MSQPERTDADPANSAGAPRLWRVRGRQLRIETRPLILGVVNVTPDSFSDGGLYHATEAAVAHGLDLVAQGADLLDIGGESTRPGALPVSEADELKRVLPVVEALAERTSVPLSVDTSKSAVARACLARGAHIINDVTALAGDPEMVEVVRSAAAGAILMHMQSTPATMQLNPQYTDVVQDLLHFFEDRLAALTAAGLSPEQLALDPGIGFGKTLEHNLELLAALPAFQRFGLPMCLGVSRKGFLGRLLGGRAVGERLAASLAVVCHAQSQRAVQLVRVHDVRATRDALTVIEAMQKAE